MTLVGRFPIDPLAARLGINLHQPGINGGLSDLATRIGVTRSHLQHVARHGLTDRQADHWALRCGLMPQQVWDGQWWDHAPDEGDDWYSDDPPLEACTPPLQQTMDQS